MAKLKRNAGEYGRINILRSAKVKSGQDLLLTNEQNLPVKRGQDYREMHYLPNHQIESHDDPIYSYSSSEDKFSSKLEKLIASIEIIKSNPIWKKSEQKFVPSPRFDQSLDT